MNSEGRESGGRRGNGSAHKWLTLQQVHGADGERGGWEDGGGGRQQQSAAEQQTKRRRLPTTSAAPTTEARQRPARRHQHCSHPAIQHTLLWLSGQSQLPNLAIHNASDVRSPVVLCPPLQLEYSRLSKQAASGRAHTLLREYKKRGRVGSVGWLRKSGRRGESGSRLIMRGLRERV